jgi:hypothetical protein
VPTAIESQPLSIRRDKTLLDHLKRVARYESFQRDQDGTYADLLREAIVNSYPMPKDEDADSDKE